MESSGKSDHAEGIDGGPINAARLKPVIDQLMRCVIKVSIGPVSANGMHYLLKGADKQWRMKAIKSIECMREDVALKQFFLKGFLAVIERVAPRIPKRALECGAG